MNMQLGLPWLPTTPTTINTTATTFYTKYTNTTHCSATILGAGWVSGRDHLTSDWNPKMCLSIISSPILIYNQFKHPRDIAYPCWYQYIGTSWVKIAHKIHYASISYYFKSIQQAHPSPKSVSVTYKRVDLITCKVPFCYFELPTEHGGGWVAPNPGDQHTQR